MNKGYINEIELHNYMEKINFLIKVQEENLENINNHFDKILALYNTTNTNKIIEINEIEKENYKIVKDNINKYLTVINYTVSKYQQMSKLTQEQFSNIKNINI